MFGRATITLGIGPHSSSVIFMLRSRWRGEEPRLARCGSDQIRQCDGQPE